MTINKRFLACYILTAIATINGMEHTVDYPRERSTTHYAQDICGVCFKSTNNLSDDQKKITNCCSNIICQTDVNQLKFTAESNKQDLAFYGERQTNNCPYCNHYPLSVRNFSRIERTCEVCLSDDSEINFALLSCQHIFCRGCLGNMLDICIREKNSAQFKCPNPACGHILNEQDVRRITLSNQKLSIFSDIKAKEWLAIEQNAKHCPTPDCPYSFINDNPENQKITCPSCDAKYCSNCLANHEEEVSCQVAKQQSEAQQARQNQGARQARLNEQAFERWRNQHTKECPRCHAVIQKNGGCNHMTCQACRYDFCWECLGRWQGHENYYECNRANTRQRQNRPPAENNAQRRNPVRPQVRPNGQVNQRQRQQANANNQQRQNQRPAQNGNQRQRQQANANNQQRQNQRPAQNNNPRQRQANAQVNNQNQRQELAIRRAQRLRALRLARLQRLMRL